MEFGNPILNIAIFLAFVVVTLVVVIRVSRTTTKASDFYHGGRAFSGRQNGIAIAGDYLYEGQTLVTRARSRDAGGCPPAPLWGRW